MPKALSASARRVQQALDAAGLKLEVVELPDSTRTAVEAAQAIGCRVGQIAKSLVFETRTTSRPILVIASGPNRVQERLISELVGEKVELAKADFVRAHTGFTIGGVPPIGHKEKLVPYIDQDLLQFPVIWAAAGTPHAVFQLCPDDLLALTRGRVIKVN